MAFGYCAIIAVFTSASFLVEIRTADRRLRDEAERLLTRLDRALSEPFWMYSRVTCDRIIEGEMLDDDYVAITLIDKHGMVFSGSERDAAWRPTRRPLGNETSARIPAAPGEFVVEGASAYDGEEIGSILARVTTRFAVLDAFGRFLFGLASMLAAAAVGVVAVWIGLERRLIERIARLNATIVRFTEGDYASRAESAGGGEIDTLAKSFNAMADSIDAFRTDMEALVEARTRQVLELGNFAFVGRLVAGVAHEINTPVGVSLTAVSHLETLVRELDARSLEAGLDDPEIRGSLESALEAGGIVSRNLSRIRHIITSFKQLALDQSLEDPREFALGSCLEEAILNVKPRLVNRPIRVEVACDPELRIVGLRGAYFQIANHLLENSVTHGFPEGRTGTISVSAGRTDGRIAIEYRDDGIGIPKRSHDRLFTPFFRGPHAGEGVGLGLYVVASLVKKLGGRLDFDSDEGRGVSISISIPIAPPAAQRSGAGVRQGLS